MDISQLHKTGNTQETRELGKQFASLVENNFKEINTICLYGELGSGKTTFTQGFGEGLGINERILSPTFILQREYPIRMGKTLYHFDLYRLELNTPLNLSEYVNDPQTITVIEWAEKLGTNLPIPRFDISFKVTEGELRTIEFKKIV